LKGVNIVGLVGCHGRDAPELPALWHGVGFFTETTVDPVLELATLMRVPAQEWQIRLGDEEGGGKHEGCGDTA